MMNNGILLDSDIIIWFLKGRKDIVSEVQKLMMNKTIFISPISVAEIYAGARPKEEKVIGNFLNLIETIPIDKSVGKIAGKYLNSFSKSHNLEIADALIAASANNFDLILCTLNKKHYPMLSEKEFHQFQNEV